MVRYIGETARRLGTRIKEHQDACAQGEQEKSTIADHAWSEQHLIHWKKTLVIDQARSREELLLKEALHIQADSRYNRDVGLELPGCWISVIKSLKK